MAKVTVKGKSRSKGKNLFTLKSQDAEEGASITLSCELSKPGLPVEWKKGTQVLRSGEKYQMKQNASVNELLINKVVPEDSGEYSCVCGDQKTTLSKPGLPVEWKKGTQVLRSGEKYQMKQNASVNELLINKVVPEDSGEYSCVCGDQKTTASLNIKGRRSFLTISTVLFLRLKQGCPSFLQRKPGFVLWIVHYEHS
uniref:Ig-like domain-containing protein n=1 Tax=Oryzias latipes TaxID=8090 RepID=A0A3P9LZ12_ORYLA